MFIFEVLVVREYNKSLSTNKFYLIQDRYFILKSLNVRVDVIFELGDMLNISRQFDGVLT